MPFSELIYHIIIKIDTAEGKLHKLTAKVVQAKIEEEIEGFGGAVLTIELMPDHAHILAQSPPNVAPDDIVKLLTDSTSELVAGMGRDEKLIWQSDFGVVSVSKSHVDIVSKYVQTQRERHASGNINETLERTTSD